MFNQTKSFLSKNLVNVLGWRTNHKIIVIESDDWGTIRMSSRSAFKDLLHKGYPVDQCPYNSNDSLECNTDLELLFEVLGNVKGNDGKPAIITANNIVANPDFKKIKDSEFQEYHYEAFTESLKRYPEHNQVMDLYRQGISSGVVMPQFHGREHLNVMRWMDALKQNSKAEKEAFNRNVFSPKLARSKGYTNEYMDALDFNAKSELIFQKQSLQEGLDLFEKIWGFRSKSFIAPCYIWHSELEKILVKQGVKYIQGLVNQLQPTEGLGFNYKKIYHYQGQKNKHGQRYFIRNAFFEPSVKPDFDWESDCLRRIKIAFSYKKPAIISSHRLNYSGFLNSSNRETNLKRLKTLLFKIKKTWPDVQFMSTGQLGDFMNNRD